MEREAKRKLKAVGEEGEKKKVHCPSDPTQFLDYAITQPVTKNQMQVDFEQLNEKQRLAAKLVIDALESGIPRKVIVHGEAGTGNSQTLG